MGSSPTARPSLPLCHIPPAPGFQGDASLIENIGAFAGIAVVVIVTPGPDTALTIRNTLLGGRAAGIFTAGGVATGQLSWAMATSAGVAALLQAFHPAYTVIKLCGAAYLLYLGLLSLRAALRRTRRGAGPLPMAARRLRPAIAYLQGLLSNLGNPKMAVFFISLLPQFVISGRASFLGLLVLGIVFCAMTFAWLTAYSVVVARLGDVLRRSAVRRALDGLTGLALVAIGVRVAAERG